MDVPGVKILPRSRVDRYFDQLFSYPLTVVRAPMGFGKTTALWEYAQARGLDPIWLSPLGSGGSLACCWERLCARIGRRDKALARRLRALGFPMDAPQRGKIVDLASSRTYPAPTVLVVDDYHLIDCTLAADLLTLVAEERAENLHIVLLTRDAPVLPVADLEQRGLCWVIGRDALQFRTDEIRDYFALMDREAGEDTLRSMIRWTGGWISGVYLLLRGMCQGLPPDRMEDIGQLLERCLYQTYDPETQIFLEKLSFLDAFTPECLDWVLEDPGAGERMVELSRGNAFLSRSGPCPAYRMADLLREFLQEKARRKGVDPRPIWRRAGLWCLERGRFDPACGYLLRAGETEAVLRHLDQAEMGVVRCDQFSQIHKLFQSLPSDTAYRYPLATLRNLRVLTLSQPPTVRPEVERRLADMEQYFLAADLDEERRTFLLGEIHSTWIFAAFNDAEAVVAHAQRAVDYFHGRCSCIVGPDIEFTYGAPHLLYCFYRRRGALEETAELIAERFHVLARAAGGFGSGSGHLALAEYALETGNFDGALLHAQKALRQARLGVQTSIEICATFVLSRICLYRGNFEEGEGLIRDMAAAVDSRNGGSVLNTTMELCAAYINSCFGKVGAIPVWIRENNLSTGSILFQGVAFPYIVCMRSVLLTGAFVRLEVLCEEFRKKFVLYNNQLGLLHDYLCSAVAKSRLYGIEAGCEELERALVLAAPDGVVMPFAENAVGILPMLRKVRCSKRVPQDFLARVTACCEQYQQCVSGLLPSSVSLTEREREILQMLEKGMKHEEIAKNLFISVPTVRYHVKNAYQKLEVNNKISAIQKARSLNLI